MEPTNPRTDTVASEGLVPIQTGLAPGKSLPPCPATEQPPEAPGANRPSFSPPRPPYMPQFTAATEMILKRMRGESGSLNSALSASLSTLPAVRPTVPNSTYEDVKRRLVMGMATSSALTMHMPIPAPATPTTLLAPFQKDGVVAGPTAPRRMASTPSFTRVLPAKPASTGKNPAVFKSPAKAGTKRKRGRPREDDTSSLSSLDSDSEMELSAEATANNDRSLEATTVTAPPPPPTTTKSGRQVQKPVTYNPAAMEAAQQTGRKRPAGAVGKQRTVEQALCRRCSRMHSPHSNQMVFCDGCNDGWHQMCHEPWIEDDIVRDAGREWFCAACQAKRERHFAGKRRKEAADLAPKSSWPGKTAVQKRAYLSSLSAAELVGLLMHSIELHPDLPIFPAVDPSPNGTPRSLFASSSTDGLFTRAETVSNGHVTLVRKSSAKSKGGSPGGNSTAAAAAGRLANDVGHKGEDAAPNSRENSPLRQAWPRPGAGLYSRLPPEDRDSKHLVDGNDYEAFSVLVYDGKGQKVSENGIKV